MRSNAFTLLEFALPCCHVAAERASQPPSCFAVVQIQIRKLLASVPQGCVPPAALGGFVFRQQSIACALLMRVFSVSQIFGFFKLKADALMHSLLKVFLAVRHVHLSHSATAAS